MPNHDKIKKQYEEAIAKGVPVQVQWKVNSWSDWIVASSPSWDKNIDYRLVLVTPYEPEKEDQMNTCEIPAVKESLTTQSKSEDPSVDECLEWLFRNNMETCVKDGMFWICNDHGMMCFSGPNPLEVIRKAMEEATTKPRQSQDKLEK